MIRECRVANAPVLGLCLGAQLIARAFGQRVYRFGGLEVGYPTVHLTPAALGDPLFQGLDSEQRIMQMHEDSFNLPQEAVLLMRNDTCENQAFRIGKSIYAIQAHPEVTRKDARNFPRDCWSAMTRHYGDQAEVVERRVLSEVDAYFENGAAFCRAITDGWLGLVNSSRGNRSKDVRPTARAKRTASVQETGERRCR